MWVNSCFRYADKRPRLAWFGSHRCMYVVFSLPISPPPRKLGNRWHSPTVDFDHLLCWAVRAGQFPPRHCRVARGGSSSFTPVKVGAARIGWFVRFVFAGTVPPPQFFHVSLYYQT